MLARNNRSQESIHKYQKLTKDEPNDIQNYIQLCLAYQLSKDYDKAWQTMESGFKIDANNGLLLFFAGEICKCLGKYDDAIVYWDKSFEIDNEIPDNLFSKAFLYQELGEREKSVEMWKEIISWLEQRAFDVDVKWANKELEKLMISKDWSRLYSSQIKSGENYKDLNKTITINILNFNYVDSKKYHSTYHLYEDDEKIMLSDILQIHFVELPKFLEERPKLDNNLDRWLAFLTNPQEQLEEGIQMGEPEIRKAITVLDMLSRDPETVRLAELRMKQILDERSMLEGARDEAKEEDALNFLKLGVNEEIVAQGTGLSIERIKELVKKISK